jgi:CheY-like chemotaxis protein
MARGRKILIVEDDALIALVEQVILETAGYEVVGVVANAEDALSRAATTHPDLVVMDIHIARAVDGIEAATQILQTFGIRSIFATANVDPATKARGAAAHPLGWVPKPYTADLLLKVVAQALEKLNDGEAPR